MSEDIQSTEDKRTSFTVTAFTGTVNRGGGKAVRAALHNHDQVLVACMEDKSRRAALPQDPKLNSALLDCFAGLATAREEEDTDSGGVSLSTSGS
mmetsp:Transcript_11460/g.27764  ORF Transcript_11460/g.27764 Transcript_11460/m.27764 type:complete len:95 (-) Transcript_11460:100-384(-)